MKLCCRSGICLCCWYVQGLLHPVLSECSKFFGKLFKDQVHGGVAAEEKCFLVLDDGLIKWVNSFSYLGSLIMDNERILMRLRGEYSQCL